MPAYSRLVTVCSLLLGLNASGLPPAPATPATRPISDAESVLAVYREVWGRASSDTTAIIFAAWPDGFIVWSDDHLDGGPPYRSGRVDPRKVTALLTRFDQDGLFAHERLNNEHCGPHLPFTTVFIKSNNKHVMMRSWHELMEGSNEWVCDQDGETVLDGRHRLDVLRKAPPEYASFYTIRLEAEALGAKLAELDTR